MKKKMQINKKKEERRGTQEKMLEPAKSAKSAKAANTGKQTKSEKSSKPAKSSRPAKLNKPAERADAVCPYAKKCGGCDYQGMPYEKQLKEKQAYVQKQVGSFCKVLPILGLSLIHISLGRYTKLMQENKEENPLLTSGFAFSFGKQGGFYVYSINNRWK